MFVKVYNWCKFGECTTFAVGTTCTKQTKQFLPKYGHSNVKCDQGFNHHVKSVHLSKITIDRSLMNAAHADTVNVSFKPQ